MRTVAEILQDEHERRMRAVGSIPPPKRRSGRGGDYGGGGRPRKVTDAVLARMKELRDLGHTQGAIAKLVGVSETSTGRWLQGTGRAERSRR